jgi:hypothetical protein
MRVSTCWITSLRTSSFSEWHHAVLVVDDDCFQNTREPAEMGQSGLS